MQLNFDWIQRNTNRIIGHFSKFKYRYLKKLIGKKAYRHFSALLRHPVRYVAYKNAAWYLANIGCADQAIKLLEKSLSLNFDQEVLIFYFQTLMFTSDESYTSKYLYKAYSRWGETLTQNKTIFLTHSNELSAKRRIKIGYTCHFITNSTSTTLLLPLLKAHHRDRVEVYMYSDEDPQTITDEIKNSVEHWRDVSHMNTDTFCHQVRKDQIDILVELNGLIIKNRYEALAKRPAPVQVNFYNHAATSGVPGVDYILLGEDYKIDHLQPYFSEKIFHKKGITLATVVSSHFADLTPLPSLKNGYITFGSFGQIHKVSIHTIELWSRVLKRVPNSKFYLKSNYLDKPEYLNAFKFHFERNGIDLARIIFEGPSDYADLLAAYSKVDIALDTLPYAAGTTTIEACISGVPVISHINICDKIPGRIGYFNLHSIGHEELLGESKEDYVEKAVALANDRQRLEHYRKTLRHDVMHSRRANMELYIRELEDAYGEMWAFYLSQHQRPIAI